jgi:hypothetical protein
MSIRVAPLQETSLVIGTLEGPSLVGELWDTLGILGAERRTPIDNGHN